MTSSRRLAQSTPRERWLRTSRAFILLSASTFVRMMREGLVLRSMIWPGLVTILTLAATLIVVVSLQSGRDVAVAPATEEAIITSLREADFDIYTVENPAAAVRAGDYSMGTDGRGLWIYGTPPAWLELESIVRTHRGSRWRPIPLPLPTPSDAGTPGDLTCKILAFLFVLYGLVFGLGGVARDRDDGTLEAELTLPIPRAVGGLARWTASSIILSLFYSLSVFLFSSVLPVQDPLTLIRHGSAAASTGVAIGLVVVGTAGLKQGFSGPFAAGMTFSTGLAYLGGALHVSWLPIASLFGGGTGWSTLFSALLIGVFSAWSYGWRAGSR